MRFKSLFIPAQDGQCQRLSDWDNKRCEKAIYALHHRVHPERADGTVDLDLFYDPANIAGCCARHHPAGHKGDTGAEKWHPTNIDI
jgi:hypothetical protein